MDYEKVQDAIGGAWIEFYHSLSQSGFTDEQINKLDKLLDHNDCFNDVISCVMEAGR